MLYYIFCPYFISLWNFVCIVQDIGYEISENSGYLSLANWFLLKSAAWTIGTEFVCTCSKHKRCCVVWGTKS